MREATAWRKSRPSGQAIGAFPYADVALHSSQVPHCLRRIGSTLMAQCGGVLSNVLNRHLPQ
ncbi:hypothetical protein [Paraburkholderia mimosarum]|uniref:hypothetical protein n=1 Tax=Paraburkholderia mimosarum TaxID=312026 RepID=UPI00040DFF1C|nr:hypothetical protein [Paraburkholderia mimosarum]